MLQACQSTLGHELGPRPGVLGDGGAGTALGTPGAQRQRNPAVVEVTVSFARP